MSVSAVGGAEALDPFRPLREGRYADGTVDIAPESLRPAPGARHIVRTEHFDLSGRGPELIVRHVLTADTIDEDLTGLLWSELFEPGWVRGADSFERIVTGVVRTTCADPLDAWTAFYRNTIRRLDECVGDTFTGSGCPQGIEGYAPVYTRARALCGDSVLELGCCFGFLSLLLARDGIAATASDVSAGTVGLLSAVAARLGLGIRTLVADATHVPAASGCADTVLMLHLLEHLDDEQGERAIAEALRLARRRAVIAVPLEEDANETFGHVRTIDLADLDDWGRRSGRPYEVAEHHGGWLTIDCSV
ncbi:mycofactocin oligosaccharide methyltransferase MftM [Allobranchiibius sp. CTAmp26]|uniref:mycofactocin oligosaccharide methyltransferase MftM n=1 Tax=Allobranchiibius sp. CTAmp26 TaxID=2815214 RepID=UPI001AA18483|nr:mycofactocin oligosaccharide methyltransferase MftM [Allobranchiibius sp. CTAmp26]MBO1753911.1 class I SAM-dependent methyltransferase [Allobranchiibius sp. CTAmp26]